MDGTLIKTISGKTFPEDITDFRIQLPVLNKIIEKIPNLTYFFIVTNQGGIGKFTTEGDFQTKLFSIERFCDMYFRDRVKIYFSDSDYCTSLDKEQLHSALLLLMSKLEDIKSNPMQDKTFVVALTEVLRYFRDNGELKEAFKQHKAIIADMEKQPFCKAIMDMFCARITAEHPELPPLNIKETVEKLSSDEFIESKIKSVLE